MKIQVRATKRGFLDGSLREKDATFTIEDKQFSKEWMEKVGKGEAPAKPGDKKKDEKEPI